MRVADDTFKSNSECEWVKQDIVFLFLKFQYVGDVFFVMKGGSIVNVIRVYLL